MFLLTSIQSLGTFVQNVLSLCIFCTNVPHYTSRAKRAIYGWTLVNTSVKIPPILTLLLLFTFVVMGNMVFRKLTVIIMVFVLFLFTFLYLFFHSQKTRTVVHIHQR